MKTCSSYFFLLICSMISQTSDAMELAEQYASTQVLTARTTAYAQEQQVRAHFETFVPHVIQLHRISAERTQLKDLLKPDQEALAAKKQEMGNLINDLQKAAPHAIQELSKNGIGISVNNNATEQELRLAYEALAWSRALDKFLTTAKGAAVQSTVAMTANTQQSMPATMLPRESRSLSENLQKNAPGPQMMTHCAASNATEQIDTPQAVSGASTLRADLEDLKSLAKFAWSFIVSPFTTEVGSDNEDDQQPATEENITLAEVEVVMFTQEDITHHRRAIRQRLASLRAQPTSFAEDSDFSDDEKTSDIRKEQIQKICERKQKRTGTITTLKEALSKLEQKIIAEQGRLQQSPSEKASLDPEGPACTALVTQSQDATELQIEDISRLIALQQTKVFINREALRQTKKTIKTEITATMGTLEQDLGAAQLELATCKDANRQKELRSLISTQQTELTEKTSFLASVKQELADIQQQLDGVGTPRSIARQMLTDWELI